MYWDDIPRIEHKIDQVLSILSKIYKKDSDIMSQAQDISAVLDQVVAVEAQALTKIQDEMKQLADDVAKVAAADGATADMAALAEKAASVKAATDALSAVINPPSV